MQTELRRLVIPSLLVLFAAGCSDGTADQSTPPFPCTNAGADAYANQPFSEFPPLHRTGATKAGAYPDRTITYSYVDSSGRYHTTVHGAEILTDGQLSCIYSYH